MWFRCRQLRFTLEAREPLTFPPGKAANVLRGAFGLLFRRVAPQAYPAVFEPRQTSGPSGLADIPRPFVFRSAHLDGMRFAPGDRFHFTMNLFEDAGQFAPAFAEAFELLAEEGLGPGRASARLTDWTAAAQDVDLAALPAVPLQRLAIHFVTPTEIKADGALLTRPEFAPLAARIRDRISTLRDHYGPGPLDIDFRAFAGQAAAVRLTHAELATVQVERRSSRTQQTHPLGGFTGTAVYEGPLTPFAPYLEAATRTGVGRQTVWGKGQIALDPR